MTTLPSVIRATVRPKEGRYSGCTTQRGINYFRLRSRALGLALAGSTKAFGEGGFPMR